MPGVEGFVPPRATYRLQLTKDFTFAGAAGIADYLAALGISHAYLSPILMARPGSTHGYDVVDHDRLNPELGTEADFDAMVDAFRAHGLGIILDIVPNHMGIGPGNPRWMELLAWGEHAENADFFDVDWQPPRADLAGRILLPVLGRSFGAALEAGEITLAATAGGFIARYYDQHWPLSPVTCGEILGDAAVRHAPLSAITRAYAKLIGLSADPPGQRARAAELAADFIGLLDDASSRSALDATLAAWNDAAGRSRLGRLLDRQCWRLADWRCAADDINYRRFFAINDLIGVRVEDEAVYRASHRKILSLVGAGRIDGLRIDHIDGLLDPKAYLDRLAGDMAAAGRTPFILVEKILGADEALPAAWPVAGTTGYDRLGPIDRLFADPDGDFRLSSVYRTFTLRLEPIEQQLRQAKRLFLDTEYAAEMDRLTGALHHLAGHGWTTRDFSRRAIGQALKEIIVRLTVYRTYLDASGIGATDRDRLADAIADAREAIGTDGPLDFLEATLTADLAGDPIYPAGEVLAVARKFQRFSGPAMAKGLEDTTFFRHVPLLALNEVGAEPGEFALLPERFHAFNEMKQATRPLELIAGSTHDTKRGEDARARLLCLSSTVDLWEERLRRWYADNAGLRTSLDGTSLPSRNDEYALYQTIIGAWPPDLDPADGRALIDFATRIEQAALKAAREAKEQTSWNHPSAIYETALTGFVRGLFDPGRSEAFLRDMTDVCAGIGFWGALTSLSATLLRLTTPGIPDLYQGSENWNLSLVDPDNRRPVDYAAARMRLATLDRTTPGKLVKTWRDGRAKTHLVRRTLALRARLPRLFDEGAYRSLAVDGMGATPPVAFERVLEDRRILVVAPRLWPVIYPDPKAAAHWGEARLAVPPGIYESVLTDERFTVRNEGHIALSSLLRRFPVGLLLAL